MANSNKQLKITIIISIFSGIIIIGAIILFLIYLRGYNTEPTNNIETVLPEEQVLSVSQQIAAIKSQEEKRKEGYNLNEKPFVDNDYEYDQRTVDFRLVCTKPCPVSKQVLDQEFASIAYAVSTLRGLTKTDITPSLLPFEVHASTDIQCDRDAIAYKTIMFDSKGNERGLLCFFYDKMPYNEYKFPYSTSVHEVAHLFEEGKVPDVHGNNGSILWEGLSEMMDSFFLKGNDKNSFCWEKNAGYKEILKTDTDAHWVGGDLFFELCKQYGFDYQNLPSLFQQLDAMNGKATAQDFVNIINNIVKADTSSLFKKVGVI